MITRIELKNFMSHEHTVIEPAAGLTVLVGPNNVGKSAVVAALQILCHNDNSTYVLRHGERECSVEVETDDGHAVTWKRKNSPSYVIDGQVFDRLRGAGLPDELHRVLRLPKVDAGGEADFDIHFGTQKSPIFLLGSSSANAARFFASSSDAIRLVGMQKRHKDKLADAQREKNALETRSKELNAELELLEPAVDIDHRLEIVEEIYEELVRETGELSHAYALEAKLGNQLRALAQHEARVAALTELSQPPELADVGSLAILLERIVTLTASREHSECECQVLLDLSNPPLLAQTESLLGHIARLTVSIAGEQQTQERMTELTPLVPPPELADDAALTKLLVELDRGATHINRLERGLDALGAVVSPPQSIDTSALAACVAQLAALNSEIETQESSLTAVRVELEWTATDLRTLASISSCSLCGSPLDPERVVARAAAGLGGHAHD